MKEIKTSIIMPVYGVEEYVGKAIESIQSQTLREWELFCVDDGSKDRSGIICDEYAAKDSRIKVIHKENGGAPSARNAVIPQASGKYMYFMDSDDWADPHMLEEMYNLAEEHNAQLVIAGFYIETYYSDTEKFVQEQYVGDRVFNSQKEFRETAHELFDKNLLYTPWNKLYRSDYILSNNILFPDTFWDDFPFNLKVIRDIEKVVVTSKKYYHFIRKREESETAKYRPDMYKKREEENEWMHELYEYWDVNSDASKEFLARRYIERVIGCVENIVNKNCKMSFCQKRREIKKMISTENAGQAVRIARPNSFYMKIMLIPIKLRSSLLLFLEGKVISKVKTGNIKLFAVLKAGR